MKTPSNGNELQSGLEAIARRYVKARDNEAFGKHHELWETFERVAAVLRSSEESIRFQKLVVRWSAGQGRWATVPWIAGMDLRETSKTSEGVYVIYLFCADMSGVYLTLNQGASWAMSGHRLNAAHLLRERASRLRTLSGSLGVTGFEVKEGITLKSDMPLIRAYEHSTVAYKFYARDKVPSDKVLLEDWGSVLAVYEKIVPSRRIFGVP